LPPAPVRFSTTNCCPSRSDSSWAIKRAALEAHHAAFTRAKGAPLFQAHVADFQSFVSAGGEALRRFRNPYLGHACTQVGADGSRKLPQRFGPVVRARKRRGLHNDRVAMVSALWVAAVGRVDLPGGVLPAIADPDATRLAAAAGRDLRQLAHAALSDRFDEDFVADVTQALEGLVHAGAAAVEALA